MRTSLSPSGRLLRFGLLLVAASAGLAAGPAHADTIALRNGRRIEGHILSQSPTAVKIEVPGGQMDLPRSQIVSIEESLSIEDQYAQRYLATDQENPDALEALATWARKNDLELRARFLEDHARGVRLDKRFARARTATELLDVAAWAKSQGLSTDVRRLAVARALRLEPKNATARTELALIKDEDRRAFELERLRELAERERAVADREKAVALRERALREKADERAPRAGARTRPPEEAPAAGDDPSQGRERPPTSDPGADGNTGKGPELTPPPPPVTYIVVRRGRSRRLVDDQDDDDKPGSVSTGRGNSSRPAPPAVPAPSAFSRGAPSAPSVSPNAIPSVPQLPRAPSIPSPSGPSSSASGSQTTTTTTTTSTTTGR